MNHNHEDPVSPKYSIAWQRTVVKYDQPLADGAGAADFDLLIRWTCCQKLLGPDDAIAAAIFSCLMNHLRC